MTSYRQLYGTVYILENAEARRAKVGTTINDVAGRLRDMNDLWLEHKLTCQICGTRRLASVIGMRPRLMPTHVVSGVRCPGGNALPLEADQALAKSHLAGLRADLATSSGAQKSSLARKINALESRIRVRERYARAIGKWQIRTVFRTQCAEEVELLAHQLLGELLDNAAPVGEVFCCAGSVAEEAVKRALDSLGLLHEAKQDTPGFNVVG